MMYGQTYLEKKRQLAHGSTGLVAVYKLFDNRMEELHLAGLEVPETWEGQYHFVWEVRSQLFDALAMIAFPHDDSVSALMTLIIPDLLFARMDHVAPINLLKCLGPGSMENWNEATRLIEKQQSWNTAVTISDALDIVDLRVNAEIGLHRPVTQFFKGAAYAH